MAAELEKLAQIIETQGSIPGAEITRVNAQVMLDLDLIPAQLENPPKINDVTDFKRIGQELANEGYYSGAILVRDLGASLLSTGVIFVQEDIQSKSPLKRRRVGSSADLIMIDGKVLRELRAQNGIKIQNLAKKAHISGSIISMIEHGRYSGNLNRVAAIALANELGVSLDEITLKPQDITE